MEILTTLSNAFLNAKITKSTGAAVVNTCAKALARGPWVVDEGKGWNARLSFKTAKLINMPECTNPLAYNEKGHRGMAYDSMVRE